MIEWGAGLGWAGLGCPARGTHMSEESTLCPPACPTDELASPVRPKRGRCHSLVIGSFVRSPDEALHCARCASCTSFGGPGSFVRPSVAWLASPASLGAGPFLFFSRRPPSLRGMANMLRICRGISSYLVTPPPIESLSTVSIFHIVRLFSRYAHSFRA